MPLATVGVDPGDLFRISRHRTGEPYFGKSGGSRFDDPTKAAGKRYGTCYFGFSVACAFAETVLHDAVPVKGRFPLAISEIESRYVLEFTGQPLILADFTGEALMCSGATSEISTISPYDLPQLWSRAVHDHPDQVDGILYQSNRLNTESAVVLFDRAAPKLTLRNDPPLLLDYLGALRVVMRFRVDFK